MPHLDQLQQSRDKAVLALEAAQANAALKLLEQSKTLQVLEAWGDLVDPLTRINKISRMNLLVVLATCHGQHLFSTLIPGRPSPAWAIVTPEDWILDEEGEDG